MGTANINVDVTCVFELVVPAVTLIECYLPLVVELIVPAVTLVDVVSSGSDVIDTGSDVIDTGSDVIDTGSDVMGAVSSSRAAEAGKWLRAWLMIESC